MKVTYGKCDPKAHTLTTFVFLRAQKQSDPLSSVQHQIGVLSTYPPSFPHPTPQTHTTPCSNYTHPSSITSSFA
jgi:hypothetical protein